MDVSQFLALARNRVMAENWGEVSTPAGRAWVRTYTGDKLRYVSMRYGMKGTRCLVTETVIDLGEEGGEIVWGGADFLVLSPSFSLEDVERALSEIYSLKSSETVRGPVTYQGLHGSFLSSGGSVEEFSGVDLLSQGGEVMCQTSYIGGAIR